MPAKYNSSEQFCDAAKTEYEYERGRNANLDNKVSMTLTFCGVVLLYLINNYLNFRFLWNLDNNLKYLCVLFQFGCLLFFCICIFKLFRVLKPREYIRLDTDFLLKDKVPEWENEQSYMYLGIRYSQFAVINNKVNEKRSKDFGCSVKWLLLAILLFMSNEAIQLNFLP